MLRRRLRLELRSLKALWKYGLRAKSVTIRIAPQDIGFVQYPEFFWQPKHDKSRPMVRDGDWDRVVAGRMYWSGRYEKLPENGAGMLSLENYVFFTSAREHFLNGVDWEETGWMAWVRKTGIKRYRSEAEIGERLAFLERLYEDGVAGRFMNSERDYPLVNIGREGRIAIDDGRHRLCMAIIAGLSEVPVRVCCIHPEAISSEYGARVLRKYF
ncbi:MAG: hypothetical protein AAGA47_12575 [Pseudomonadota bacterium]